MMKTYFTGIACIAFGCMAAAQPVGIGVSPALGNLHIKGSHDSVQLVVQAHANQSVQKPLLMLLSSGGDPLWSLQSFNDNIWLGKDIGQPGTAGYKNIYIGSVIDNAPSPTPPYLNIFMGDRTGLGVGSGRESIGIGKDVFSQQADPVHLVAIGSQAANMLLPSVTNVIGIGYKALNSSFGSGPNNVAIGYTVMGNCAAATNNVAIGNAALHGTTAIAQANNAALNTAIGTLSLNYTRNGGSNTAVGFGSMITNYSGNYNVAMGHNAFSPILSNTSPDNVAIGFESLKNGASNGNNTAIGVQALYANVVYANNVAIGYRAAHKNVYGGGNTAIGYFALQSTENASNNTAIGYFAGDSYDNNANNVFVGANTDVSATNLYNVIAIGQGTIVAGPSTARFGNGATGSYGGWANWTNVSDGRFKTAVQSNVPGLSFIVKLRPVTYQLDAKAIDSYERTQVKTPITAEAKAIMDKALAEKERIIYTGFIAQEVEAAATAAGFDFSGVDKPKASNDVYGLRYEEFVVPIIKAVQEQQQMLDDNEQAIKKIKDEIQQLKSAMKLK